MLKLNNKFIRKIASVFLLFCTVIGTLSVLSVPALAATSGKCGDNVTWTLDASGTLTIAGNGPMDVKYPSPWNDVRENIKTVVIQNGVTTIGRAAFFFCFDLASVVIPNSVTAIEMNAFASCNSLTSIVIPNGVTTIEENAFLEAALTSVTIPGSVKTIGIRAFAGPNLSAIAVEKSNSYYTSDNGILFDKDKKTLIQYPEGKKESTYIIPDGVTTIGNYAFDHVSDLNFLTIPNSVTTIGGGAFQLCKGLTSVVIPNSVTTIGDGAFYSCKGLTSIVIPNSVTTIGKSAFEGSALTSVTIPGSVKTIGAHTFRECYGLKSITIPANVTVIKKWAFWDCDNLTDVYYKGTQKQWDSIIKEDIDGTNQQLKKVNYHFNVDVIKVYLNNLQIQFDVAPVMEKDRTLVPVRAIFEAMGMKVDWNGSTKTVTAEGNGHTISMRINDTMATVDGKTIALDVPARIINERTFVPVRFIAESLNAKVDWNGANKIVYISAELPSDNKIRNLPVTYVSELPYVKNVTVNFNYSDSYFVNGNAYSYNHALARASMAYEMASWDVNELKKMYNENLKVANYELYHYDKNLDCGEDKAAYSIAHKRLYDGSVLLTVALRGAKYGAEWRSNFHVGDTCYHKGFYDPAYEVYENLKSYANSNGIDMNSARLWITGFSRGAAIANLVSGFIDRDILNNGKKYFDSGKNLYAYLFAVPAGVDTKIIDTSNAIFNNIYNIILPYDVVPKVVMEDWGWGRFGKTLKVKNRDSNPQNANEKYFTYLTKNMHKYSIGTEQTKLAEEATKSLASFVGNQKNYVSKYEGTIMDCIEYVMFYTSDGKDATDFYLKNNYKKTDEAFAFYIDKIVPISAALQVMFEDVDISEVREKYIIPLTVILYENQFPLEEVPKAIGVILKFVLCFKPSLQGVGAVKDAHNSEYYTAWLFGYDNIYDIYE